MYYLAKSALKWNDEDFWDSSPKFLFKQMELFSKYNKQDDNTGKSNNKNNKNKSTVETNVVRQKLRCLPPK